MKAVIKKVRSGKQKGQFRFELIGTNGETIATSGSENYTQKHNAIDVLSKYFPTFTIEDKTK